MSPASAARHESNDEARRLRVCIQQPSLAAYRVPLYRQIARDPRVELKVVHGESPQIRNVPADGFEAERVLETKPIWLARQMIWHRPQIELASRKYSDVLVLSGNLRYASLLPGLIKARRHGVATVLWGHHQSKSGGRCADWLRRRTLFRLADCILCYNNAAAASIRQHPGLAGKVNVAHNAIDQEPIQNARREWLSDPQRLSEFRQQTGIGDGPNLLFVSRIKPRNRIDQLLYLLQRIRQQHPAATASIVGGHNEEQQRLAAIAADLGLQDHVFFPGAIYDEPTLAPWFLSADLFVYPAQIGLSLFHAFGYGLPVIAGQAPGRTNPEIEALQHGVNGFLHLDDDLDAATQLVLRLIENRALRDKLSTAALHAVDTRFNISIMADNFIDAILFAAGSVADRTGKPHVEPPAELTSEQVPPPRSSR